MLKNSESQATTITGQQTERLNTVQTVLSQDSIRSLEYLMYWYWNDTDHYSFIDKIMKIFSVYIEHYPKDKHGFENPKWLAESFISDLLTLNERLMELIHDEKPYNWVEGKNGFYSDTE